MKAYLTATVDGDPASLPQILEEAREEVRKAGVEHPRVFAPNESGSRSAIGFELFCEIADSSLVAAVVGAIAARIFCSPQKPDDKDTEPTPLSEKNVIRIEFDTDVVLIQCSDDVEVGVERVVEIMKSPEA